jgi:FlaA1/EpsC-like NDP-sugar epimerase
VERLEPALFTADRELGEAWPSLSIVPVVAHAAAHKHVLLMETNATEAVKNNVLDMAWASRCTSWTRRSG